MGAMRLRGCRLHVHVIPNWHWLHPVLWQGRAFFTIERRKSSRAYHHHHDNRRVRRRSRVTASRVVVLGGHGNFGVRICRALAGDSRMEVLAAGRRQGSDLQLDLAAPDFAVRLKQASPHIVIHCAGPFQGQDYRVARAALAAGAHYIDVADGRSFVARFGEQLNGDACAAGRLALSGASTLPALSAAVLEHLAPRFRALEEVRIAIAPGQRAPRGAATLAGVLTYAGRSFKWLSNGE